MSAVTQKVPAQKFTTGILTKYDEETLEKKLILVFARSSEISKRESLAQECYSKALEECTSYGFLHIISSYSISNCWDNRRAVSEAIINHANVIYDIHPNLYRVLVSIGERNRFTGLLWTTLINGLDTKEATSSCSAVNGQPKRLAYSPKISRKKARIEDYTPTRGDYREISGAAHSHLIGCDVDESDQLSNPSRRDQKSLAASNAVPQMHPIEKIDTVCKSRRGGIANPLAIHTHGQVVTQPIVEVDVKVSRNSMPGILNTRIGSTVERLLDFVTGFDKFLIGVLYRSQLSTLDSMTLEICRKWKQSTTSHPRMLKAEQCWNPCPPTTKELVLATWDNFNDMPGSKSSATVFSRGERDDDVDPREAIAQLIDPEPTNPIFLTGLRLPMLRKGLFRTPTELSTFVEPYEETNIQLNLTPKYSFVDLHIDYATDGVSAPIGKCVKIWVMYPPTAKNLSLMQSAEGQKAKLTRIGPFLEGGVISKSTSVEAIYLPAGCIHATFTIEGGYLIAIDFTTMDSAKAFSAYIARGIDNSLGSTGQRDCFNWFAKCLDVTLINNRGEEALKAWINALERLEDRASSDSGWRKKVKRIWASFLSRRLVFLDRCPCGGMLDTQTLRAHLEATHLSCLYPKQIETRCKRYHA